MKHDNHGYDKTIVVISKESREVAHLPGIGKFCKCGCGKRITGYKVTRRLRSGNTITYDRKPQENKVFATRNCKLKYFARKGQNKYRLTIGCGITLIPTTEKNPSRTLTIYGKLGNQTKKFIITPKSFPTLWKYLDTIQEFRSNKTKQNIKEILN